MSRPMPPVYLTLQRKTTLSEEACPDRCADVLRATLATIEAGGGDSDEDRKDHRRGEDALHLFIPLSAFLAVIVSMRLFVAN
jgi:hypothetical protein